MTTLGQRRVLACSNMDFAPIEAAGRRVAAIVLLFAVIASLNWTPSEAFWSQDPHSIDGRDAIAGFIFGGRNVDINRHPYLLSLRRPDSMDHACGAALVTPAIALTAAHCVTGDADLVVLYRDSGAAAGGDVFKEAPVSHVVPHPDWTGDVKDGADVALIVLKSPLEDHPTLKVLPQPDPATWDENKKLYVVGWGLVDDSGAIPSGLQGAELRYHSLRVCNSMYREAGFGRHVVNGDMMCAGADGAETCQGDSGGPLIIKGRTWEHDIGVGVVSFGNSHCGDPSGGNQGGVPGVFTRLRSFAGELEAFLGSEVGVDDPVVQSQPPENPIPSSSRRGDDESATGKGWCSFAGGCDLQNRAEGVPFCDESANQCEMACGGVFCTEGGLGVLGSPNSPDAVGGGHGQHEQTDALKPPPFSKETAEVVDTSVARKRIQSASMKGGPRTSHTFGGLGSCPRVFVTVQVELIDMSFYDEKSYVRVELLEGSADDDGFSNRRLLQTVMTAEWDDYGSDYGSNDDSDDSSDDGPLMSFLGPCKFNSLEHAANTCGKYGVAMCGKEATALVSSETGELTVNVYASERVKGACDGGMALNALVAVECSGASSAAECSRSGNNGELLESTGASYCPSLPWTSSPPLSSTPPLPPKKAPPPKPRHTLNTGRVPAGFSTSEWSWLNGRRRAG